MFPPNAQRPGRIKEQVGHGRAKKKKSKTINDSKAWHWRIDSLTPINEDPYSLCLIKVAAFWNIKALLTASKTLRCVGWATTSYERGERASGKVSECWLVVRTWALSLHLGKRDGFTCQCWKVWNVKKVQKPTRLMTIQFEMLQWNGSNAEHSTKSNWDTTKSGLLKRWSFLCFINFPVQKNVIGVELFSFFLKSTLLYLYSSLYF